MNDFEKLGMAYAEQALIKTNLKKMEKHYGTNAYFHKVFIDGTNRSKELQSIKIKLLNKCKKEVLKLNGFGNEKQVGDSKDQLELINKE